MKASEMILQIQKLIAEWGDREVYSGGEDYPGKVESIVFRKQGDSYVPSGSFKIYTRN